MIGHPFIWQAFESGSRELGGSTAATFTSQHDALAAQIKSVLDNAAFHDTPIDPGTASSLSSQAKAMVSQMQSMAASAH